MKQTGESECVRVRTQGSASVRARTHAKERDRYAMVKIYGDG